MTTAWAFVTSVAGLSWLLSVAIKAGLLLAVSWVGPVILPRSGTPAARHHMLTLGIAGALVVPLLCCVVPSLAPSTSSLDLPASTTPLVATASAASTAAAHNAAPTWPAWLALVWAAGALVVATRAMRGHLAARRLVRTAESSVAASWMTAMHEARESLGLTKRVDLLRSAAIGSPVTIGVARTLVMLPAEAEEWTPARLRAVLIHELGHVRRRDLLVQLAATVACALYWWNPIAWLAAARLRVEREHACDDLVLGTGILPSSYATDLLDIARSISAHAHVGAGCMMVERSATATRLQRVLDPSAPRRPVSTRARLVAYGSAFACTVLIACTSAAPPEMASTHEEHSTISVGTPYVRGPGSVDPPYVSDATRFGSQAAPDLSSVTAEVNRRLGTLDECYRRRLASVPALSGTVVIHWSMTETGKVVDACITKDTIGDREITACVNKLVLEGGDFPALASGGSIDVVYPFVFGAPSRSTTVSSLR